MAARKVGVIRLHLDRYGSIDGSIHGVRSHSPAGRELIFRVEDCLGLYELLASRGAEFLAEPHVRGGETRAFFRDPDGHLFEISQLT